MDAEIKAKWVAALRSGKYRQGRLSLVTRPEGGGPPEYCCLGVLCKVAGLDIRGNQRAGEMLGPKQLARVRLGQFQQAELSERNDGHQGHAPHSFEQIADYIEANL